MKWPICFVVVVLAVVAVWHINKHTTVKTQVVEITSQQDIIEGNFGSELYPQNLVAQNAIFESTYKDPSLIKSTFLPIAPHTNKSPLLAATLGVIPGLGHVYLSDLKTASALAGSGGVGLGLLLSSNETANVSGEMGLLTTSFYSVYAAYRDARLQNGSLSYFYRMPTENLEDLAYAPFQWSVIKKPEVWGGIVATLGLAIGAIYLAGNGQTASIDRSGMPYLALPMGIGEEAFFRGFLQSALSEHCTPWGGIALSSVAFGAAHIRNAFDLPQENRRGYLTFGLPLLTGLGVYYGWLTYKNHSLKESVAAHTWYNFIVMMTSFWISHRAAIGAPGCTVSFVF